MAFRVAALTPARHNQRVNLVQEERRINFIVARLDFAALLLGQNPAAEMLAALHRAQSLCQPLPLLLRQRTIHAKQESSLFGGASDTGRSVAPTALLIALWLECPSVRRFRPMASPVSFNSCDEPCAADRQLRCVHHLLSRCEVTARNRLRYLLGTTGRPLSSLPSYAQE